MKALLHKTLLATMLAMFSVLAHAHDFEVDGIYYNITSSTNRTVEVTYRGSSYTAYSNEYSGSVSIPSSVTYNNNTYAVTSIGEWAFYNCSTSMTVTIPSSVTSIDVRAFYECSGLTRVTIPNSVTSIGIQAFWYCTSLTRVTIPNSVKSLGSSAFMGCSGLTNVTIGNSLTSIGSSAFCYCTSLTSVTIGNGVTSIGNQAFRNCSSLTGVVIPNSVTSIGGMAFYGCTGLTSVDIPNSVDSIGDSAFEGCTGLTSVVIGNSVTSIENWAFYDCTGLTSITIPNSVTSIGYPVFPSSIKKVIWLGNTPPSGYANVSSAIHYVGNDSYTRISSSQKKVYPFLSSMFEVNGIKYVPVSPSERTCDAIDCTYSSDAENTVLASTVTNLGITFNVDTIRPYVCYNNDYIKNIQVDFDGEIPEYAFYGCGSLTNITISGNVTAIGNDVFTGCTSLSNVNIADREEVLSLGYKTSGSPLFADCPLKTVYIGGNITYGTTSSEGYSPFYRNTTLETVTITDKETEISGNEFYGCTGLKSITMGDGVESIGNWAFSGCSSLETFSFGSGMKTIGQEAFSDCTAMTSLTSYASEPPTCDANALDDINKWICTLHIPTGTSSLYQAAEQWKEFFFVSDDVDTGISTATIDADASEVSRYNLSGQRIEGAQRGVNIIRMSDGSTRKVLVE